MAESIKSKYKPSYPSKYKGDPNNIICRSSWERKFCRWCDLNENILQWGSEEFHIPYISPLDRRVHKYYPDFFVKMKKGDKIEEYVVEIKPKAQLQKPKEPKRKTAKALKNFKYAYESYVRNLCKTNALNKMAKERNCKVMLLTEDSKIF